MTLDPRVLQLIRRAAPCGAPCTTGSRWSPTLAARLLFFVSARTNKDIIIKTTCNAVGGDAALTLLKRRCLGESTKTSKTSEIPPPPSVVAGSLVPRRVAPFFFGRCWTRKRFFFVCFVPSFQQRQKKKTGV